MQTTWPWVILKNKDSQKIVLWFRKDGKDLSKIIKVEP